MDESFMRRLIVARELAGIPFPITSGYRCDKHDDKFGGARNHTTGRAVDIACSTSTRRAEIVIALLSVGLTRIEIADRHIHVDAVPGEPPKAIWLGRSK